MRRWFSKLRERFRLWRDLRRMEAGVLVLEPDDTLVVSIPGQIETAAIKRYAAQFQSLMPDRDVILLDGGASLSAIRQKQAEKFPRLHEPEERV